VDRRWIVSEMVAAADARVTTAQVTTAAVAGGGVVQVVTVPLGPASLVLAVTAGGGVVGCGAIDPGPLGRFGIAAARVRPTTAPSVGCAADLLAGVVTEANVAAQARGVVDGMAGEEALRLL